MLNREAIYGALFARLKTVQGIKTFSRRLRHYSDVSASEQPALFMAQGYQRASYEAGRTVEWNLGAKLYLYVRVAEDKSPAEPMNALMDSLMAIFAPDNPMKNACTLGGLVWHCQVGDIETDEGTLGPQAFALIPLDLRVPGSPI